MVKIIMVGNIDLLGGYEPFYDEISLNRDLKKFPLLYKFCKEHELRHSLHRKDVFYHFKLDLHDYLFLQTNDVLDRELKFFRKTINKRRQTLGLKYELSLRFINSILLFFSILFIEPYKIFKRFFQ